MGSEMNEKILKPGKLVSTVSPNQENINKMNKDFRVQQIKNNIQERAAKFSAVESKIRDSLKEVKIIEDHVELVDGGKGIALHIEGFTEGFFIEQADIDSGEITIEQGYQALADLFEHGIVNSLIHEQVEKLHQVTLNYKLPLSVLDKLNKTIASTRILNLETKTLTSKHEHLEALNKLVKAMTPDNIAKMNKGNKVIQFRKGTDTVQ